MRRALVCQGDVVAGVLIARHFQFDQQGDTARQQGQFFVLTRDNIRQIIDAARQMGDFFLELVHGVHSV